MNRLNSDINIVPARIKEARLSRGLSLTELAGKIRVTSQAISQYELGISKPSATVLEEISKELDFPIMFFTKPFVAVISCNSAINFRALKSASKKLKDSWEYRIKWLDEINQYLRKYINFPQLDFPEFNLDTGELDFDTIEEIALTLRKHWKIEKIPINNLVELLQEKGFIVARIEFGEYKIDAFSQWFNNFPYIISGSDKNSAVRSRFNLAHELGHLILHAHIDLEMMSKKEIFERVEREANHFAGAFLLPRDSFPREVMSKSIEHFIILKKRWMVSIQMMVKRCQDLNIYSETQARYLFAQIGQRGYRKSEPLDDSLDFERPYLFKQAIELLLENEVVSPEEIIDEIAFKKELIDSLCFLPDNLLNIRQRKPQLTLITKDPDIKRA